jgi:hypothetical protein
MRFLRYVLPLLLAVLLIGIAVGRAYPDGQRCQDAKALLVKGAITPTSLADQATAEYTDLLR